MATTYQLISSVTVGSGGASSIDFTSIPSTYTDLCVVLSTRSDRATGIESGLYVRFNGSSSSYSQRYLAGGGSSASSGTTISSTYGFMGSTDQNNNTTSVFGSAILYIPNYAGSNNKSYSADTVQENNATAANSYLTAGLWSNTAAINQLTFYLETGSNNFVQYSTAYLYGIKNS